MTSRADFHAKCEILLEQVWVEIEDEKSSRPDAELHDVLAARPDLIKLIRKCQTSKTKSYHYVLLTHLLAKVVDPSLNILFIQVGSGEDSSFDARSLAHKVVVPFDQRNLKVLGGSPEPYANNPLRISGFFAENRSAQKSRQEWDNVVGVLEEVESTPNPELAMLALKQVLIEIHRLREGSGIQYPTPNRVSLDETLQAVEAFIAAKSGGDRLEAVVTALLRTLGVRFGLFSEVRRGKVNASDKSSGMAADIECYSDERVALLVEVKDRSLSLVQLNAKLDEARARRIEEMLFIAQRGRETESTSSIDARISSEFRSGQNVYITNFDQFAFGPLILLGEEGRVDYLSAIGSELDRVDTQLQHRKAWADILKGI